MVFGNNTKMILISNDEDEVLCMLYEAQDGSGKYIIVEPANGSIKAEVFNGTEPMVTVDEEKGILTIDRSTFIIG